VLSPTDLRELGWERRAIDAIFRDCDVVAIAGYSRPVITVATYRECLKRCTYNGDKAPNLISRPRAGI
jgi:hypothetical protein